MTLLPGREVVARSQQGADHLHFAIALHGAFDLLEIAPMREGLHLLGRVELPLSRIHHGLRLQRHQRILRVRCQKLVVITQRRSRTGKIELPPRLQRLDLQQHRAADERQDSQHLLGRDGAKKRALGITCHDRSKN